MLRIAVLTLLFLALPARAEPLNCTISALGADRVMFAADHPFEQADEAGHFLDTVPLADKVRADICVNNATRLLGLA